MKQAGHVRWLYRELPELVAHGVMHPEAAERIRRHYGDPEAAGGTAKRWAVILFSILGAALIGGGIILLLAHNWEELSRPVRAAISVAPLFIAALLGAWVLWTERESTAWREGVGTAQTLAIGASLALISQTYNIGGRFDEFMLTWSLLALPVAYLLRATFPALLYLVGIVVWTGSVTYQAGRGLWYFPLLAAALPFLWWTRRPNPYHSRPVLLAWVLAITLPIGTGIAVERVCDEMGAWPVVFGGMFALFYLAGTRWWGEAAAAWQRPLQNAGALGVVGLALILSYSDVWSDLSWWRYWKGADSGTAVLQLTAAALFPAAALGLWAQRWRPPAWTELLLGAMPLLAAAGWAAALNGTELVGAVLFNLYLSVIGIGTLVVGLRARHLGTVNAGMLVLTAVILCRFFDVDLDFLVRGIAFILIGTGFLVTNMILLRGKGKVSG